MTDLFGGKPVRNDHLELRQLYECQKVVQAGIWLIRHGYGRLMMLPCASASGHWRLSLHVPGNPELALYRYSAPLGSDYLGIHCAWKLRRDVKAEKLAEAILSLAPEHLKQLCIGDVDSETERWLQLLESSLNKQLLPEAFHEYTRDYTVWDTISFVKATTHKMHPQPGYVPPHQSLSLAESDPMWRDGLTVWEQKISNGQRIEITVLDEDSLDEVAEALRNAMLTTTDSTEALALLKASIGRLAK